MSSSSEPNTRSNESNNGDDQQKRLPIVVGIGASAGGLDALRNFLACVSENSSLSFVIIQHLDPTHESALTDLLSRETSMKVEEVSGHIEVQPNHVYVIPPNKYLSIQHCVLKLSDPEQKRGSRRAIDYFLSSLAKDQCEHAIGIILSGTGSDGTAGLRDIKEAGGLVIAQSPEEAGQDGMPRSAINSGYVDLVLPVSKMPERLLRYVKHSYLHGPMTAQAAEREDQDQLGVLTEILRRLTDFDFRRYRRNTLLRRVQRRMGLQQIEELSDYLLLIQDNEKEAQALARDLLIGVTHFFRNSQAWELLDEKVLVPLFEQCDGKKPVRVWVAGCASGEEAYTVAMLLHEHAERHGTNCRFQIFATDIAVHALEKARAGFYPESISDNLSKSRLRRFFNKEAEGYKVKSNLRESVVFAQQNVLSHPPFSKLDLITCRNLLIYLEPDAQKRLLSVFQFALKEHGHLFLGSSESIGERSHYFESVSREWRIYKRKSFKAPPLIDFTDGPLGKQNFAEKINDKNRKQSMPSLSEQVYSQLLSESESAIVVVNSDRRLVFLQGPVEDYLQFNRGELSPDLPELSTLAREGLRAKLRTIMHRVPQSESPIKMDTRVKRDGQYIPCRITARRLKGGGQNNEEFYLVTFEPVATEPAAVLDHSKYTEEIGTRELELELSTTREQLNSTIEELETANEELKASNEEAMTMNEELQSNNEELETSKEELQSLNEELTTLNNQLELKVEQLQRTTNDLNNLMSSTQIAVVFLDSQLRIRMFTPAAKDLFHVISGDVGRRVSDITMRFSDRELLEDAEEVLHSLQPRETQVLSENGRSFVRRIVPYRSDDNRIEGVVLTFSDVSRLESITEKLRLRELQQAALAKLGHFALQARDLQILFEHVSAVTRDTLEIEYVKILELLPDGEHMLLRAGVGWREGLVGSATVGSGSNSQAGHTLRSDTPIIVENLASEARFNGPELLVEHGVVSGMSVIIRGDKEPFGVFGAHTAQRRVFTNEDVNFLQSVSNILSEAMERNRVESALKESEERFRMLADNISQLAWTADALGHGVWYNKRWYEYTGLSWDEVQGDGWKQLHHPDHLARVMTKLEECSAKGEAWEDTFPLRGRDGSYRWFLSRAIPIRDDDTGKIILWFGTNTDITARRYAEESLRESEELVRTIAENSTQGLVMMNEKGICTYVNNALLKMTGYSAEEIRSRPLHDLVHHHHPDGRPYPIEDCPIDRALPENNSIRAHEDLFFRKDGSTFPVMCAASPIFKNGKPVSTVIEIRDITQAKQAEESLRDADRRKDEFLATLSHELRNPLAPIRGGLDVLMLAKEDPETVNEVCAIMSRQLEQLIRLVDDLLDVTRITRGKMYLRKRRLLLSEIVDATVEGCRRFVEEAGQQLAIEVPEKPISVEADPNRLTQVLCNLLHNASKYTPQGGHITLHADSNDSEVILTVKDDGIGISNNENEHIFEMFGQIDPSGEQGQSGLGIGLTLVKSLVDLHGGQIKVKSEGEGQGTSFIVELPILADTETENKESTPLQHNSSQTGHRILVVDDNDAAAKMLSMLVQTFASEVRVAFDGLEAIEIAAEFRPDVILTDIGMPRMNGYEAAKKIREHSWGKDIVLVALTGWGQDSDKKQSEQAGFNHHLTKPADIKELRELFSSIQPKQ
mgnify:CR=1 FL=1